MEKVRYMISDAANLTQVEAHVLRYWEDELDLDVPRNEMGHRYYTKENIEQFQRIKELKEQGYQLKAIRMILHSGADSGMAPAVAQLSQQPDVAAEERMAQFRELMCDIVGHAIALNNEELSQNIGREVGERVLKEMNYLTREQNDAQEERFRKLDEALRGSIRAKKKPLFGKDKPKAAKLSRKEKKESKAEAQMEAVKRVGKLA